MLCAGLPVALLILAGPTPAAEPVTVLDAGSVWRTFPVLKPPVLDLEGGRTTLTSKHAWLDRETPAAPADWAKVEFADGNWLRGSARTFAKTAYLANLSARAKFDVIDPAQVQDLKLTVSYHGGAIVYLNGEEIARRSLPESIRGPAAIAEGYGPEAYLTEDGKMVGAASGNSKTAAARERKLTDFPIPATALRKGVNVLAIEVVRAPYNNVLADARNQTRNSEVREQNCPYDFRWFTCELRDVRLTAATAAGLVPNASRPKELQAWTSDFLATDTRFDFGDRCDAGPTVVLKGPRNGWSSGKLVVGSPKAIEGLKAVVTDLKQDGASIPASHVRIRYAVPYGARTDSPMDCLLETPLDSFAAIENSAVVPIWLTVKVPADAKPGVYKGQVAVEAKGEKALIVPISLEVADFAVPDTQDYRTWMELMQSPDTLALEYKVPLWSEKHWAMIADSMRYIGEIGSRVVHIPLIAQANYGNEQSMVRFIPKGDGTYDYDFSVMDRYLDLAEKHMGRPKFTVFTAWDIYLDTPKQEVKFSGPQDASNHDFSREGAWVAARWELRGKGPFVTIIDPRTKELGTTNLPRFDDGNARAIWKPLFDELHKRMAKRGLEGTMLLGMASDRWANKQEMALLQEVSGDLPWINQTHGGGHVGSKLNGMATVAYTAYVWNVQYANSDPINSPTPKGSLTSRMYGWKRPELYAEFRRGGALSDWPHSTVLLFPELQITGGQRGLGRVGADFWPVFKDKQGRRRDWVWDRYPQSLWHSCNLMSHMLLPGPTGPVASVRYEQLREGVQECEARIAIERVLTDDALKAKVAPDLAKRSQQLLDDRVWQEQKAFSDLQLTGRTYATSGNNWYYGGGGQAGHLWYAASGWQDRTQALYDLAGEVTKQVTWK